MKPKTVSVSEFKAKALEFFENVRKSRQQIQVTKRGKLIAVVGPPVETKRGSVAGRLAHTVVFEGDIVSPLEDDLWEANR